MGKKLLKSGGNITLVIDNLEKQDLVKRERGKEDRRLFYIYLTEKGKNLFEKIFPEYLNSILGAINILTDSEQIEFQRLCKKIGLKKLGINNK